MRNGIAAFSLIVCVVLLAVFPTRIIAGEETKADPDAVAAPASGQPQVSSVVYKDGERAAGPSTFSTPGVTVPPRYAPLPAPRRSWDAL